MTTMTNPTNLDVKIPDPSFMDDYDTGGGFTPPPQPKTIDPKTNKPKYVVFLATAPVLSNIKTRDGEGNFLKTRDGYLKVVLEDVLLEGGYTIKQTHIGSAQYRKFKNGQPSGETRNASPFIDYLHAQGIELKPGTAQEYEEYVQATAERQFQVTIDWSAYDNDAKTDVASKWEEFPDDPDVPGSKLPFIEKDGKRFWARASVKRFVSAITK